jgi:hypothetical protein
MNKRPPREKSGRPDPDARKAERMATALRANLARRKAQKKSRAAEAPADGKQG